MTNPVDCRRDCELTAGCAADLALAQEPMPVWRASVRMALVSAVSLIAAGIIATGIGGCADMPGIAPAGSLRDVPELAAPMQNTTKLIAANAHLVSANGIFDR